MAAPAQPYRRGRSRPRTVTPDSTVQALDRAVQLLRTLAQEGKATLSGLALRLGMPPSSAHRLLMTLQTHALVEFNDATQEWLIGVEAFRIGSAFVQRDNLVEVGREVMRRVVEQTGETANLAIVDGAEVVVLTQIHTTNPIRAFFSAGTRVQMHCSGAGKALLAEFDRRRVEQILQKKGLPQFTPTTLATADALFAELDAIRKRGWALDNEERFAGMRCIAASIFDVHGEPVAGLSISGPASRLDDQVIAEMGPQVRRAAEEITKRTGGHRPQPRK